MSLRGSIFIEFEDLRTLTIWPAILRAYLITKRIEAKEGIEYEAYKRYGGSEGKHTEEELEYLDLLDQGWIILPMDTVRRDIGMSYSRQRKYLLRLQSLGLVDVKIKGCPPKRWVWIDYGSNKPPKKGNQQSAKMRKR